MEVLLAVFLAGLCATLLAATMPVATTSRARADLNNKATSLAQKHLEAVRGLGYANAIPAQLIKYSLIDSASPLAGAPSTFAITNVDNAAVDSAAQVLPSGTGRLTLEQVDLDLRRVTVEIRYSDRGTERSVTVGTLIANL